MSPATICLPTLVTHLEGFALSHSPQQEGTGDGEEAGSVIPLSDSLTVTVGDRYVGSSKHLHDDF